MRLTDKQVKDFVYTFKLPISVIREKYFDYYVELLDPYYDVKKKLEIYKNAIKNNEDDGSLRKNNLHVQLIKDIKNKKDFLRFSESEKINNLINGQTYIPHLEIYQRDHNGKYFISIDLNKANFQCLKYFGFDLFNGKESFNEFIDSYTKEEILKESKILRQVVFGTLNPKRQQAMQKNMMLSIEEIVKLSGLFSKETKIYSMSSDEIYFEAKLEDFDKVEKMKDILNNNGFDVRVEHFRLHSPFVKPGYYKEFTDGSPKSFNLVPKDKLCQFIKLVENKPFDERDFLFCGSDGELSKHMEVFYELIPETQKFSPKKLRI
jgi:hypothetical protein